MSRKKNKLSIIPSNSKLIKLQRQTKISRILSKNQYISHGEIAEMLGISAVTVGKDIAEMNNQLSKETMFSTFVHRARILQEISEKKRLCSERLASFSNSPTKGSRWLEEWTKLIEKECKILGIYSPDKRIVAHIDTANFSKEEKDAAVKAALLVEDVIDVGKN